MSHPMACMHPPNRTQRRKKNNGQYIPPLTWCLRDSTSRGSSISATRFKEVFSSSSWNTRDRRSSATSGDDEDSAPVRPPWRKRTDGKKKKREGGGGTRTVRDGGNAQPAATPAYTHTHTGGYVCTYVRTYVRREECANRLRSTEKCKGDSGGRAAKNIPPCCRADPLEHSLKRTAMRTCAHVAALLLAFTGCSGSSSVPQYLLTTGENRHASEHTEKANTRNKRH